MKLTFILCLLAAPVAFGQTIIWKEGKKLMWDNFKSPVSRKTNANVVAHTNCGWELSVVKSGNPKLPVTIELKTVFNEEKSWKDTTKINDYVLLHEQKHFDIAELFVRKFRKTVAEKIRNSADYHKYFKTIYDEFSIEYKKFQIAYDRDTRHGIDKEKQAEYNASISEELENLKSYQSL
ncbi:DUF922 domain-containing Zn-dependent protease [Chryseobacterium sp. MEBOG06]|uniref:DUF922 domain-containing Zn-dependent protease n=1 Tax=Chryseobacterium sp. MEBOG06 TaxID=2879938 RepID=UPI001F23A6E3|nr:DUF922 domain-containing Zn-dependent protease [Chryseobacterium sp. MEBOG06]UKB85861.1 DUF922 domain-containing Zn-dependent protease [Chryseobacterium sp. MEBOG06]